MKAFAAILALIITVPHQAASQSQSVSPSAAVAIDKASDAWLPTAVTRGQWRGFKVKTVKLDGVAVEVAEPATAADGKPWLLFVGGLNYHSTEAQRRLKALGHDMDVVIWADKDKFPLPSDADTIAFILRCGLAR